MQRSRLRGREAGDEEGLLPQEVLHLHQVQAPAGRVQLRQRTGQRRILSLLLQGECGMEFRTTNLCLHGKLLYIPSHSLLFY